MEQLHATVRHTSHCLGHVLYMDTEILVAINSLAGKNPNLDRIVVYLQNTYFTKGLVPVLVLVALYFSRNSEEKNRRINVLSTLTAVFIAIFVARLMQIGLPYVERPFNTPGLDLNSAPMPSD